MEESVNLPYRSVKKQKIQLNMVKNEPIVTENAPPPPKPAARKQLPIPSQTIYTGEGKDESDLDIWCDTFSSKSSSSSESQDGGGDKPRVVVPGTKCRQLWKPWQRALILKVLGLPGNVRFKTLQHKVLDLWSLSKVGFEFKEIDHGYVIVRFYSRSDYERVLENGPWMISKRYLAVTKWRPYFVPSLELQLMFSTFIWIRVPKLPVEFRYEGILLEIGNALGKGIKIDDNSLLRGDARICVDIDFTKPLVPFVVVNGQEVEVLYLGLESEYICNECRIYCYRYGGCGEGCHRSKF